MNFVRFYNPIDKHDPMLGALVILGDAGIDFFDLDDEHSLEWWTLYAYLLRN